MSRSKCKYENKRKRNNGKNRKYLCISLTLSHPGNHTFKDKPIKYIAHGDFLAAQQWRPCSSWTLPVLTNGVTITMEAKHCISSSGTARMYLKSRLLDSYLFTLSYTCKACAHSCMSHATKWPPQQPQQMCTPSPPRHTSPWSIQHSSLSLQHLVPSHPMAPSEQWWQGQPALLGKQDNLLTWAEIVAGMLQGTRAAACQPPTQLSIHLSACPFMGQTYIPFYLFYIPSYNELYIS